MKNTIENIKKLSKKDIVRLWNKYAGSNHPKIYFMEYFAIVTEELDINIAEVIYMTSNSEHFSLEDSFFEIVDNNINSFTDLDFIDFDLLKDKMDEAGYILQ